MCIRDSIYDECVDICAEIIEEEFENEEETITCLLYTSAPVGLSKRGRNTESDADIQLEEILTFFSNKYSICIST